jgi:ABC-type Fe3+ transport system permease subunit
LLTQLRRSTVAILLALAVVAVASGTISLADPRSRGLLVNTLSLTAGALAIAVPVGALLGVLLARFDVWGRRASIVLLGSLLLVPLYLQAAAWQAGFGIEGWQTSLQSGEVREPWLDGWRGAIWVHGCAGIPWVALFVGVAARTIPREWEELALLDLSAVGVFLRVTLRLLLPAVLLGALWVAITTMSEMSVTDLFAVRTYAEELYIQINLGSWNAVMDAATTEPGDVPALVGMVVTLITSIGVVVLASAVLVVPRRLPVGPPLVFALGKWRATLSLVTWLLIGIVVLLPLSNLIYKAGGIVWQSEAGVERGWSVLKAIETTAASPADHTAEFTWSLLMAASTAAVTLLIAAPLAHASRRSNVAACIAFGLALAGMALPGPLVGLGLISIFSEPQWRILNYLYDDTIAVAVVGQSLRAFPLTYFLVWHALRTVPPSLTEMALLDGAGPLRRMWLAVRQRPGAMVVAALGAAVVSVGELAATILVAPPGIEPLSIRIFGLLHYNVMDQLAAITLMLILLHAAAVWVLLALGRRALRQ